MILYVANVHIKSKATRRREYYDNCIPVWEIVKHEFDTFDSMIKLCE
jgi:hypothetical protein